MLQHAYNPVNWYPWGGEAFDAAGRENKPIFLSIGYSTCHWCHVMEKESFEDEETAKLINDSFIPIKVDKEVRPDVDSIYMTVCQAFTGSGGWPLTIIMTPSGQPFFAGTYFPKNSMRGLTGLTDILNQVARLWRSDRKALIESANKTTDMLRRSGDKFRRGVTQSQRLISTAVTTLKETFDKEYGGFGAAPKFPTPHDLLFLLEYYNVTKDAESLLIAEHTLKQMYKGGIFDHVGGGFSRYSTDRKWLVPHFEKMLYDNALLVMAYVKAFELTGNGMYKKITEKVLTYIENELTSGEGGFYSAQDADSEGVEGKYYVFDWDEIIRLLGKTNGEAFNKHFGVTRQGNFEGKNIPNLLGNPDLFNEDIEKLLPAVYEYRVGRFSLHKDDKVLLSWNSLMIAAFAECYRVFNERKYLDIAVKADEFVANNLVSGDALYASCRNGKRSDHGFLDDYAMYIFAQINLYEITSDKAYLDKAVRLADKAIDEFFDNDNGGFYLYGRSGEQLIFKPKETYDGAIPSGNSFMARNLVKLVEFTNNDKYLDCLEKQLKFMSLSAYAYPHGHCFYLLANLENKLKNHKIICVPSNNADIGGLKSKLEKFHNVTFLDESTNEYPLINNKTTYYICTENRCLPPSNNLIL